jgi:hypothetical protein
MLRETVHYGIHFLLPMAVGLLFYPDRPLKAVLILLCAIAIDVDHLVADPIFDPNRCSIGFHPLHTYWAIAFYVILTLPKPTRIFGVALLLHILADSVDCLLLSRGF